MKNKKLLGNILLILTAFIWGTAFVFQRVGMDTIEPVTFNAARMFLAAAAVGLFVFIRDRVKRKNDAGSRREENTKMFTAPQKIRDAGRQRDYRKNTMLGGVCCGAFLTAASIFQQAGIVYTTAGKAGFITAMYMLLVPIFGFLFFRKKSARLVWLAVLIGVFGMYLLCMNGGLSLTKGDALVAVCAVLFAGHILCIDHFVEKGDPVKISVIQFLTCAVLSGIIAVLMETPSWEKIASAAVPILYCGIVSGGIGYTLQIVAQKFTDPTIASLLMSLESVFAVLAGAVLLHERMSLRETLGCVVMFAAIVLVQLPVKEKKDGRADKQENIISP